MSASSKQSARESREGDDDGLQKLRHSIAEAVMSRVTREIPGLSSHFGEDYEKTDDPEAIAYLTSGGQFGFLAFAFKPWRMWDLHVGVVPVDKRRLSLGFHISERAAPAMMESLERLGAEIGAKVQHQKAAVEYQANFPPVAVDAVSLDSIVDTITGLCRKYAPVAATIACPAEMRDDVR